MGALRGCVRTSEACGVQERLKECEELLAQDYFLQNVKATFLEKARGAIFEVFCRIHQCVDLSALARQMGMPREEAEVRPPCCLCSCEAALHFVTSGLCKFFC